MTRKNIRMNYKDITSIKCRDYYWLFIDKIGTENPAATTWEELYYHVNFDWKQYLFYLMKPFVKHLYKVCNI